ncbi:amidase [Pelagivirga sediminicola]|uniref:Amidase n=1 Tax=Pelagivirga sediminicola TaxID=2170575 RepID=A0A2T7GC56_9RHOB|nr:amidase [Pelagivirga sediminicola]PVA11997.1 amidase [Pelagivirga sediminicola]
MNDYESHDATALAALIAHGEVSPLDLLQCAIDRAEARDPAVNALSQKLYDHGRGAIAGGLPDGPFRGVPFLLKDASADLKGYVTANGARLLKDGTPATADSTLVARYKAAGLVIFGKTTTPEFSLAASTETSLTGATRNPWDISRSAGGSSGGAAAAVAAGIVPAAHGSDGGGSIRIPASCCGLFGMKPSRARNPSGPLVGEGWGSLSVAHVLTRSVRDSAAMLDATQGMAPGDPYCAPPRARPYVDEVRTDPGRLRVGWHIAPMSGADVAAPCREAAQDAAHLLASLGHDVDEITLPGQSGHIQQAIWVLVASNVARSIRSIGDQRGRKVTRDEVDAVTWSALTDAREMDAQDYAEALYQIHAQSRRMAELHARYDLILSPTLATPPPKLGIQRTDTDDIKAYRSALTAFTPYTQLFNMTGAPSMTMPLYWTVPDAPGGELPIGVMLSADFGREDILFRLAGQLETARPWFHRRARMANQGK